MRQPTHIVNANVTPVRVKPDSDSEQDTQYTLGDLVTSDSESGTWTHVVNHLDNTSGWVRTRCLTGYSAENPYAADITSAMRIWSLIADLHEQPSEQSDILTKLTIGVNLPILETQDYWTKTILPDATTGWVRNSDLQTVQNNEPSINDLLKTARKFVGTPYLWGGTTPFGIDCSGFVRLVHGLYGLKLQRNAQQQCDDERCTKIEMENIAAGDLLFFASTPEHISHVGIALDDKSFIHSYGERGVSISRLDDERYSSIFCSAGRYPLFNVV